MTNDKHTLAQLKRYGEKIQRLATILLQDELAHPKGVLLNQHQIAAKLGIEPSKLYIDQNAGRIPEPSIQVPGKVRKYYSQEQLEELKAYYAQRQNGNIERYAQRRNAGFVSRCDIARTCGVADCVITHHIKKGRFGLPTHKYPGEGGLYYKQDEADRIIKILKERKGFHNTRPRGQVPLKESNAV